MVDQVCIPTQERGTERNPTIHENLHNLRIKMEFEQ